MNSHVSPLPDGKLPYVVHSGRLMERSSDGKLSFVQPRIDQVMNKSNNKHSTPDMGPKNKRVGSQSGSQLQSAIKNSLASVAEIRRRHHALRQQLEKDGLT